MTHYLSQKNKKIPKYLHFFPFYFLLFIFVLLFLFFASDEGNEHTEVVNAKRVVDGDTILIDGDNYVRLLGIDAPEKGERCYEESKKKLEELINISSNSEVFLFAEGQPRDVYGRLLRWVMYESSNINLEMVESGYARIYSKYNQALLPDLKKAEHLAREARAGCLWQD